MNRATLIGHVGKEPEIRTTQQGRKVANFSLATTEKWKQGGEQKERTEWHNIVVFNEGLVGVIEQYVHKGDKLLVEGQIQTRKWTDQSGNDRYSTEIVMNFDARMEMLGSKNAQSSERREPINDPARQGPHDELDDEIPF